MSSAIGGADPLATALRIAAGNGLRMQSGGPGAGRLHSVDGGTAGERAPSAARAGGSGSVDPRLREATIALEGVFARELVRALRGTVPEGGAPDAPGGDLYTSLLDDHLAEVLTGDNGLGLSAVMLKQLMGGVDPEAGGSR